MRRQLAFAAGLYANRARRLGVPPPGHVEEGFDLSFLDKDPPDRTRPRRPAQPAFSPGQMET
jgi:hypothetical protein